MLRNLHALALAALVVLGGLTATTVPSSAGHRSGVTFGIGIGFGDYYDPWYRYPRPYYRHWRPRFHGAYYHHRYYDPFPDYYVPLYRRHAPPIIYQPRVHYRRAGGSAHIEWCYARYRSYRAWDNTFQPYHGPRRQCRSPYRY